MIFQTRVSNQQKLIIICCIKNHNLCRVLTNYFDLLFLIQLFDKNFDVRLRQLSEILRSYRTPVEIPIYHHRNIKVLATTRDHHQNIMDEDIDLSKLLPEIKYIN